MLDAVHLEKFEAGRYEQIHGYRYFVPNTINNPWIWCDSKINRLLEVAARKTGELNGFSDFVPDLDRFMKMHLTHEAVLSSKIEGTQTDIDEALLPVKHIEKERKDDWREVHNYVEALQYALQRMDTLPLGTRLIKETHRILMKNVRGKHKNPGEFRRSQNWIGGTGPQNAVYVPPLHTYIPALMSDWEQFLHNDNLDIPDLIKAALLHYQFESIHPFLDGNGRMGRLLISLFLVEKKVLDKPVLSLSVYLEKNRRAYYDALNRVRENNDMTSWWVFFLEAVIFSVEKTMQSLRQTLELKSRLKSLLTLHFRTNKALWLLDYLFEKPVVGISEVSEMAGVSYKAAANMVKRFEQLDILKKKALDRKTFVYSFEPYLQIFRD